MEQLNFSIQIKASKETVWKTLWEDKTYREWTAVFSEGSYAVSSWEEGAKILFLTPSGEGMFSEIAKRNPNELMAFKHLGVVKEGKEQPIDEATKKWSGAMEVYSLREKDAATELEVDINVLKEHAEYFRNNFPKALDKLKSIAEG